MNLRIKQFQESLAQQKALKVIAGIANYDLGHILQIVRAAQNSGADAVDVAADIGIVQSVRKATALTVFASSIQPQALAAAIDYGADVAEIGNYDALYAEGLFLTHEEVLRLAEETLGLIRGKALLSVTIPGHLSSSTQLRMAQALAAMGVDLIQTEGASRALTAEPRIKALTLSDKASLTISNAKLLAANCPVPIMAASGICLDTVTQAFSTGASAVGVGSAVSQLGSEALMTSALRQIVDRIQDFKVCQQYNHPIYSSVS